MRHVICTYLPALVLCQTSNWSQKSMQWGHWERELLQQASTIKLEMPRIYFCQDFLHVGNWVSTLQLKFDFNSFLQIFFTHLSLFMHGTGSVRSFLSVLLCIIRPMRTYYRVKNTITLSKNIWIWLSFPATAEQKHNEISVHTALHSTHRLLSHQVHSKYPLTFLMS